MLKDLKNCMNNQKTYIGHGVNPSQAKAISLFLHFVLIYLQESSATDIILTNWHDQTMLSSSVDCFIGLVVKASASRAEDPAFESRLGWEFLGVKSYQ